MSYKERKGTFLTYITANLSFLKLWNLQLLGFVNFESRIRSYDQFISNKMC